MLLVALQSQPLAEVVFLRIHLQRQHLIDNGRDHQMVYNGSVLRLAAKSSYIWLLNIQEIPNSFRNALGHLWLCGGMENTVLNIELPPCQS